MIRVRALRKHYRVHERPPGLAAALKSVFRRRYRTVAAVDGIDFDIREGEPLGTIEPRTLAGAIGGATFAFVLSRAVWKASVARYVSAGG
jgi:ABC-type uncharacterized transport system ATPase subunit